MCRNAHDFFVVSDTLITFMACNINDKLMTVTDRFLKYVTFDTESSETTGVTPSTPGQRVFAEALVKELEEIGSVSYTHLLNVCILVLFELLYLCILFPIQMPDKGSAVIVMASQ